MPLPRRESQEAAVPCRRRVRPPTPPAWPPGPLRTAMRMSVTFKSDGIEFRLTFWGYASRSAKRPSPAAAAPVLRSERRPIAFSFVDIYSPFRHQNLLASGTGPFSHHIRYPKLNLEADARPPRCSILTSTASPARLRWCSQVASASASDSLNCAVSGASSGRGEGRKIKDALLARETVEHVDDFAGRVKAKRVELAPRTTLSSLADRLNNGRLPDGEVVANLESEIRKLYEVGGRRFRVALLPTEIPREPGLWLNPQTVADSSRNASGADERRNCDERIVFR